MHCIIMFIFVLIIIAVIILLIVKLASNCTAMKPYTGYECLVGKTVVIIGGSKGIGLEATISLASRGCKIIVGCRSNAEDVQKTIVEQTHNPNIIVKYLDLKSFKSVRNFAREIKETEPKIDILINNAGTSLDLNGPTEDNLHPILQVNVVSSFLLTHLLIDLLKIPGEARIIFTSSSFAFFHNLTESTLTTYRNYEKIDNAYLYGTTKVLQVLISNRLANELQQFGITSNALHPSLVKTEIVSSVKIESFDIVLFKWFYSLCNWVCGKTIEQGAAGIVHLAVSEKYKKKTGKFFWDFWMTGEFFNPAILNDEAFCRKIWTQMENIVDLKPNEKLYS